MPSEQINENYNKLFQLYTEKFPFASEDEVKQLTELNIKHQMEKGKSGEEAILEILKQFEIERDLVERGKTSEAPSREPPLEKKQQLDSYYAKLGMLKQGSTMKFSRLKGRPSALWYLVPFFFGIIGGIVAYVGVKDDDEDMAVDLLLFGIAMFFIDLLVGWLFYVWVLSLFSF